MSTLENNKKKRKKKKQPLNAQQASAARAKQFFGTVPPFVPTSLCCCSCPCFFFLQRKMFGWRQKRRPLCLSGAQKTSSYANEQNISGVILYLFCHALHHPPRARQWDRYNSAKESSHNDSTREDEFDQETTMVLKKIAAHFFFLARVYAPRYRVPLSNELSPKKGARHQKRNHIITPNDSPSVS